MLLKTYSEDSKKIVIRDVTQPSVCHICTCRLSSLLQKPAHLKQAAKKLTVKLIDDEDLGPLVKFAMPAIAAYLKDYPHGQFPGKECMDVLICLCSSVFHLVYLLCFQTNLHMLITLIPLQMKSITRRWSNVLWKRMNSLYSGQSRIQIGKNTFCAASKPYVHAGCAESSIFLRFSCMCCLPVTAAYQTY